MEESAPKRRRTSPRTSLEIPSESGNSPLPERETTRHKRPSFASPTKASLARHNPQILERRRSNSPQKAPATEPRSRQLRDESTEETPSELLAKQLAKSVLASDLGSPDDSEPTPTEARQVRRAAEGWQALARRTPNRPNPRPLPPPGSDEEDVNPFLGRALRRSPDIPEAQVHSTAMPPPERPEPELPPSVPDPVSSTPPRGIHSSPLRWRNKPKSSSPLRQRSHRRSGSFGSPKKGVGDPLFQNGREVPRETAVRDAASASPRKPRVFDPNAERKEERDALLKEIEKLKKDLGTAQRENERIRVMHKSGRVLASANSDEIVALLERQQTSSSSEPPLTASQILVKAVMNPIGLLPFGKPKSPPLASLGETVDEMDIRSHHPVQVTAEDELPYLELFSPFSLTSQLSVLPKEADEPLRQLHSITLRSREMPGLFTAKVDLTVNAVDLAILDLNVVSLDPAAKGELGAFIDKICSGDCNRTMQRNVGIVSWAMGEWIRMAIERAAFWCHLDERLGSKDSILEATGKMRTRKPKRRKDNDEDDSSDEDEVLRKAELIRYLGQQWFEVSIPDDYGTSVRFEWKIAFDWTGEAQNHLAVLVGVPGKWHQLDDRASLGKIPKLFSELVGGGENLETVVRTIVALMAGDGA